VHGGGADDEAPVSGKGPGSFSRIFLGSLEKYRAKSGEVGTATEEAAAALAVKAAPTETGGKPAPRKSAMTLGLRSPLALVEAVVLTMLIPLVGLVVHKDDPFFLNQRFSWIVFAPLLLGLRHGFAPALTSAVILDAVIATAWRTQIVPMPHLPGDTMVGITALAMLTGQFSDVWKRELVRLDGGFDVLRKQLSELMRSHFLLELSHDRLQERTGKGAPTLRDTMLAVHRVSEAKPKGSLIDLADSIAEIFQTYTMVEVAGLHAVNDNGVLAHDPMAVIGRPAKLDPNDEQVRTTLVEKRLTYIETGAGRASSSRTHLIAVVPFVDAWGKLHGIMAIESMPLLAFERRNLEALAILGSHFADVIATGGKDVQRGQRKEFEIRVRRSIRDAADNDVQSTIFALIIRKGGAVSDSIETLLGGTLRALDFPFVQRDRAGNYCVYILLPVTDEAGARALGARVERIVRRELNMNLTRAGAFHFFHVLRPEDNVDRVMKALETKALMEDADTEHTYVV
jgi:polysaccharide biosynthesis protein PelD